MELEAGNETMEEIHLTVTRTFSFRALHFQNTKLIPWIAL